MFRFDGPEVILPVTGTLGLYACEGAAFFVACVEGHRERDSNSSLFCFAEGNRNFKSFFPF